MKKVLFVIVMFLTFQFAMGADYSYIYIQGDNETPFYVKLEGQMLPRLGKNYCIIPNLDAGDIHVQILFQQNAYPAQDFVIKVPENGSRGFVLQRLNDNQFSLMDLYTKKYIASGNSTDESDMAGSDNAGIGTVATTTAPIEDVGLPAFPNKKPSKEKPAKEKNNTDDRFIDDVELNNDKPKEDLPAFNSSHSNTSKPKKKKTEDSESQENTAGDHTVFEPSKAENDNETIPNTDCPTAMNNDDFENLAIKILDKSDDEARLRFINKSGMRNCYNTEQVRILAKNIESQSARYELVTNLYARVVDQENYSKLESLFTSSYLKKKFAESLTK